MQSDSVNFSGGLSDSASYSLESTAGEIATGLSDSASYSLRAGYQQMQEVSISMTAAANVVMSPTIGGITGGVANGSTSVSVLTDSPAGYQLSIQTEDSPSMQKDGDTIADYVPVASPDPDLVFLTNPTQAHFGFSPEGDDIIDRFRDNGSLCDVGGNNTPLVCWDGLSISEKIIAQGLTNHPGGATTTIHFRVVVGGGVVVPEGEYVATTTLTAIAL
ncbi:MAG TPA: hypothetical protein PKA42_01060 [Candidatus Paceibacterota bacterium]|nr:hypothetical protein [Candidatus Paceibacterota bacterium]HMO82732.1 hypothetical protein [Candidatus Paceibacterota bacterium]